MLERRGGCKDWGRVRGIGVGSLGDIQWVGQDRQWAKLGGQRKRKTGVRGGKGRWS